GHPTKRRGRLAATATGEPGPPEPGRPPAVGGLLLRRRLTIRAVGRLRGLGPLPGASRPRSRGRLRLRGSLVATGSCALRRGGLLRSGLFGGVGHRRRGPSLGLARAPAPTGRAF